MIWKWLLHKSSDYVVQKKKRKLLYWCYFLSEICFLSNFIFSFSIWLHGFVRRLRLFGLAWLTNWCCWPQNATHISLLLGKYFSAPKSISLNYQKLDTFMFKSKYEHLGADPSLVLTYTFSVHVLFRCWLCQTLRLQEIGCDVVFWLCLLADSDGLLLLVWIKCGTDRGTGSTLTLWVELSATCCLCLAKTGGHLISPGSHKLDRPTCCPDLLQILQLTFKGRKRKIGAGKRKKKTSIEF